jgi:drug/metabolite transporter (DMT)-like permease
VLIIIAAFLSACNSVLNRTLKDLETPYVMFCHGFCGILMALVALGLKQIFTLGNMELMNYSFEQYKLICLCCVLDTLGTTS